MRKILLSILMLSLMFSCQTTQENGTSLKKGTKYAGDIQPGRWLKDLAVPIEYQGQTSSAGIQIYFPQGYVRGKSFRTIIALHQYSSSSRDWEINSSVESYADKYGFVIVCPGMGASLYETSFYPETKNKWNIIPGGKFIGEVLFSYLAENFSLAVQKKSTGIIGVTVGAHGAILVAEKYPWRFGAVAGISGYYAPTSMQNSRMIESVYGSYRKNQARWETDDNTLNMAENLAGIPVFLYHGGRLDYFNELQSGILAIKLRQLQNKSSGYSITYSEKKSGQVGWNYWNGQLDDAMEFFDKNLK